MLRKYLQSKVATLQDNQEKELMQQALDVFLRDFDSSKTSK